MKVVTHNGIFHADEVFAIATLEKFLGSKAEIVRTRDAAIIADAQENNEVLVIDVGNQFNANSNFDHHQDANLKASNVLVINFLYHEGDINKDLYNEILPFFEGISDFDVNKFNIHQDWANFNSEHKFRTTSAIISGFNRNPNAPEQDIQFRKAVDFATTILENEIYAAQERIKAQAIWDSREVICSEKGTVGLLFKEFCPIWKEKAKDSEVRFAILPTSQTQWSILSIDSAKFPLPVEATLKAALSNETDFVFAHAGRFTAGFKTLEAALEVAKIL